MFVSAAYLLGTEVAFLIATPSNDVHAPFWPPNIVLLGAFAVAGAVSLHRLIGEPPSPGTVRKAATYVVLLGFVCPAIVAIGETFVRVAGRE